MLTWGTNDADVTAGEAIAEDGVATGLKEEVPKAGIPKEGGLNPKLGLSSFSLSTEGFELKPEPDLVLPIPSFVVAETPVVALDVAEPIAELDKVGNETVAPSFDELVLLTCFPKDMDPDVPEVPVGFANDGAVANEKEGAGLEGLLLVNLKTLSDEVFDESDPVE